MCGYNAVTHGQEESMESELPSLGVMAPDTVRTIVVISQEGELAVGLRERVDRAYALVRDVRPLEAAEGIAASVPWPWMVVGSSPDPAPEVVEAIGHRPIMIFWSGPMPQGLPAHARTFDRFGELATAVTTALTQSIAGMKLAVGLGIEMPDGTFARSAELQALVAAHPHPFAIPLDAFRSAGRVLSHHHIPWHPARVEHENGEGGVILMTTGETT